VAVVPAYRKDEQILTTLDKLLDVPIDMLTTVLIGNQSTRTQGDWILHHRLFRVRGRLRLESSAGALTYCTRATKKLPTRNQGENN